MLSTSPIPYGRRQFYIDFDFPDHRLYVGDTVGANRSIPLETMSVASFYRRVMQVLEDMDLAVDIWPVPVQVETVVPFAEDTGYASYGPDVVHRYWRALLASARVLKAFCADFLGKVSPVHFFWGTFDLAATRFSGRGPWSRRLPTTTRSSENSSCPTTICEVRTIQREHSWHFCNLPTRRLPTLPGGIGLP